MSHKRQDLHLVTSWLTDLASLTAGQSPLVDAKAKIGTMASALFEEYPPGAFTRQSLLAVARPYTFFPSYSEICDVLSPWWREHRPSPTMIESDQPATVKNRESERQSRESWQNISPEQIRAKIRALNGNPLRNTLGHWFAIALRNHAPQHLGLLPPEWLKDPAEPADVVKLRTVAADIRPEVRKGPVVP